jgi:hypothetical protein
MRRLIDATLAELDRALSALYVGFGRPSIAPERLLRATLLQLLHSIRSERQLVERIEFDLWFRRFVGLSIDEKVFDEPHRCGRVNQQGYVVIHVLEHVHQQNEIKIAALKVPPESQDFPVDPFIRVLMISRINTSRLAAAGSLEQEPGEHSRTGPEVDNSLRAEVADRRSQKIELGSIVPVRLG